MLALRRARQTERLTWSRPMKMSQKHSISTRESFDANERQRPHIASAIVRSSWTGTEILV